MIEIGVLGSIAYDNIFTTDRVPLIGERVFGKRLGKYIGGMAANQAIEAARYTKHVHLIGKVGMDLEGTDIIQELNIRGVDTSLINRDTNHPTGQSFMYLVGEDYFSIVTPGANTQIGIKEIKRGIDIMKNGLILISLEINANAIQETLVYAKEKGIETILIPQPVESCTKEMYETATSLILNKREAAVLFNLKIQNTAEAVKKLARLVGKKRRIVLTLGSEGAVMLDGNEIFVVKAMEVEVVDPIGAGDALAGAFAGALANGFSPQKALSIGCIAGGLTVSKVGPQSSTHSMQDVLILYESIYKK